MMVHSSHAQLVMKIRYSLEMGFTVVAQWLERTDKCDRPLICCHYNWHGVGDSFSIPTSSHHIIFCMNVCLHVVMPIQFQQHSYPKLCYGLVLCFIHRWSLYGLGQRLAIRRSLLETWWLSAAALYSWSPALVAFHNSALQLQVFLLLVLHAWQEVRSGQLYSSF